MPDRQRWLWAVERTVKRNRWTSSVALLVERCYAVQTRVVLPV